MYKFLAPELSAQFMTAATGRPRAMRNLFPDISAASTIQETVCSGQRPLPAFVECLPVSLAAAAIQRGSVHTLCYSRAWSPSEPAETTVAHSQESSG
eukprot:11465065-Ditylum_brightwellii.AAC.1